MYQADKLPKIHDELPKTPLKYITNYRKHFFGRPSIHLGCGSRFFAYDTAESECYIFETCMDEAFDEDYTMHQQISRPTPV